MITDLFGGRFSNGGARVLANETPDPPIIVTDKQTFRFETTAVRKRAGKLPENYGGGLNFWVWVGSENDTFFNYGTSIGPPP